ncbi:FKBP12 [Symbiodinium necroappetens]|uniref:peptidylprolyl isomerase n=1 Tax=Symbiodinium necroappetens TaxID=1628268 RepID=A0A813BIH8_9DINO|nr:FKBP12 [Symbiodinium necroappetens]
MPQVTVHATGLVRDTKTKFWSTKDPGQEPFTYTAGGGVIKGWDYGARGLGSGNQNDLSGGFRRFPAVSCFHLVSYRCSEAWHGSQKWQIEGAHRPVEFLAASTLSHLSLNPSSPNMKMGLAPTEGV